jgi:sulfur carrier protein
VKIIVNAKEENLERSVSIADLLVLEKVKMPDMVSVSFNGEFLRKEDFSSTSVKENDSIDFLYFMGGGSDRKETDPR